jgi:2,5-dioxopentanoate dehydrogenase
LELVVIDGSILVGGAASHNALKFRARNPATGEVVGPPYSEANEADVNRACALADTASEAFDTLAPERRAQFLDAAAEEILAIGDELIVVAMAETGLPRARLEGERGRTVSQLRMFAAEVRRGDWLDVTIDPALPERVPPRADLRRMNCPLGPVAVFGASNFPLAFSVAGGDTAAAFAAGCPVVVKGHPAHPGTGELVARAVLLAVAQCGLPAGVFAFLPGTSNQLGAVLVADPRIKAVGFTGSRSGGLALVEIAARRAEPIPVYAEMSSINPVVLLPAALAVRASDLGTAFAGSLALGAGQFCTNPGLMIAIKGRDFDRFVEAAQAALSLAKPQTMLTAGIEAAYQHGVAALDSNPATDRIDDRTTVGGALFKTTAQAFLADKSLGHEVFGVSSIMIECSDSDEMKAVICSLEGQLTATLHLDPADHAAAAEVLPLLKSKSGRVLANGWPTGVEVTPAMVHGGPFPATSDGRSTSVGTLAMARFVRPVCYQDIPDALLPLPLQDANPWNVPIRRDEAI